MISWIQKYFQKHFRLVFLIVLVAIGLPMVVIYSAGGGGHGNSIKALERPFFSVNLDNADQMRRVNGDGELSAYLRYGYQGPVSAQIQQYALQRVAGLALADQLHLPVATPERVAQFVPTLRAFQNESGQFDQSAYTRFADSLKGGAAGATTADVNRVLRDDARLADLAKLLGGPGYVQAVDVKLQLTRVDSTWTVQIASLDYASFNPAITPSDDTLKKFQADNAFRYEVPARPRLSMVEFKAADFPPPRAATEAELRSFYNANLASFPAPDDGTKKDATAPAADNFPKVRTQVEAALNTAVSRRLASEAANALTVALYEHRVTAPANSPALASFLAAQHRTPAPLAPFAPANPPADKPWLANYAAPISRLNQERFFSDPLASPDGFIVLLWNENLPGYTPSFAEVRDRVAADYKESEKRRLFIERGQALKAALQAAAKTPTGFAAKAAAEKIDVKSYANFTLRAAPQDFPRNALSALLQLEPGQVSDMIATEEGQGLFVFAQERKLPDLTPANPRYGEVQAQFAALLANNGENSVLGAMVDEELKKTSSSAEATP